MQEAYAKYVKEYYLGTFGSSVQTYNQKYLKDTSLNKHTGDRLWWFQVCTEVAYFQVAPANDSIRSSKVDARHALNYRPYTNTLFQVSLDSPYASCVEFIMFFFLCYLTLHDWWPYMLQIPFGPLQERLWRGYLSWSWCNEYILWRHQYFRSRIHLYFYS